MTAAPTQGPRRVGRESAPDPWLPLYAFAAIYPVLAAVDWFDRTRIVMAATLVRTRRFAWTDIEAVVPPVRGQQLALKLADDKTIEIGATLGPLWSRRAERSKRVALLMSLFGPPAGPAPAQAVAAGPSESLEGEAVRGR